jgi:hypothetical protein
VDVHIIPDIYDQWLFWFQVASVFATIAAAGLAAFAIWQTKKQAKESQDALVRERRINFELDLLRDLFLASEHVDLPRLRLATALPIAAIPLTRAALGLPSSPEAVGMVLDLGLSVGESPSAAPTRLRPAIQSELLAAMDARVRASAECFNP